jgi:hypothetical protein
MGDDVALHAGVAVIGLILVFPKCPGSGLGDIF